MPNRLSTRCAIIALLLLGTGVGIGAGIAPAAALLQTPAARGSVNQADGGETVVLIRHGEKPFNGLGQLTCRGLNRALALPKVLTGRFGTPAAIFAADPSQQIHDNKPGMPPSPLYSYVRPLATIEPTAIALGMPVNTQIGFTQTAALQQAVTAPEYAHSTVFIAWEHGYAEKFAQDFLSSYGLDPKQVPDWPNSDYETIYIFHIAPPTAGATHGTMTFAVQKEGLEDKLSDTCPGQ